MLKNATKQLTEKGDKMLLDKEITKMIMKNIVDSLCFWRKWIKK